MEDHKPAARKIKLLRTSKGHIIGSVTIPVLTTDTVSDLKRKVRRTLQPLTERNFVVLRSPGGSGNYNNGSNTSTPVKASPSPTSANDQFSTSGRRLSRVLSFTGRSFGSGHLGGIGNGVTPSKIQNSNPGDSSSDSLSALPPPAMPEGNSGKTVARVLSFKTVSGPLMSPSTHIQHHRHAPEAESATAAHLFPPPLSSTTKSSGNSAIPDPKTTPIRKAFLVEDMLPPSAGTPLKFVPMRPNTGPIPPEFQSQSSSNSNGPVAPRDSARRPGSHTRAASMGNLSFTPNHCHSLPVHPTRLEVENVLPHFAPSVQVSKPTTSPKTDTPSSGGTSEKRGLGAWFTDSMHTLKEHMKSPFGVVER